jgi:hypothetical protein
MTLPVPRWTNACVISTANGFFPSGQGQSPDRASLFLIWGDFNNLALD